jgi:hypothetical protein
MVLTSWQVHILLGICESCVLSHMTLDTQIQNPLPHCMNEGSLPVLYILPQKSQEAYLYFLLSGTRWKLQNLSFTLLHSCTRPMNLYSASLSFLRIICSLKVVRRLTTSCHQDQICNIINIVDEYIIHWMNYAHFGAQMVLIPSNNIMIENKRNNTDFRWMQMSLNFPINGMEKKILIKSLTTWYVNAIVLIFSRTTNRQSLQ